MPKILGWRRPGKIGRRWLFIYSPIAQSVERVTVNHDVVGSSPTWGAKKIETGQSPVSIFFVLTNWTRKAEKEKDLNGLFPAVARKGESNLGSQKEEQVE